MKEQIQASADSLADLCLQANQEHHKYDNKDLLNATLIFSHFLLDRTYSANQHLNKEEMLGLAKATGKAIRELIKSACGEDMHEIAGNL